MRFHGHLIQVKSETSDNWGWIQLLQMRVVWSESDRQFQEIRNSEGISGKSVSDWRENCKCGGKLSTHFSLITIKNTNFDLRNCLIRLSFSYKDAVSNNGSRTSITHAHKGQSQAGTEGPHVSKLATLYSFTLKYWQETFLNHVFWSSVSRF